MGAFTSPPYIPRGRFRLFVAHTSGLSGYTLVKRENSDASTEIGLIGATRSTPTPSLAGGDGETLVGLGLGRWALVC